MLRRFIVSVAARTTAISRTPAAAARSRPRRFGTSAEMRNPSRDASPGPGAFDRASAPTTSAASAICGTALGETKLVASTLVTPAANRLSMSATLAWVATATGWLCSPSRAATSVMTSCSNAVDQAIAPAAASACRRASS